MALSRDDRVDAWLRSQGLPYLVPRSRRGHDLLQRASPLVVLLLGTVLPFLAPVAPDLEQPLGDAATPVALLLLVVAVVLPVAVAWWLRGAMERWSDPRGRVVALGIAALYAAGSTAVVALTGGRGRALVIPLVSALLLLLALHVLVWAGVGSILAWAARWAWSSLGAVQNMASRALPVILVLVVFAFFSSEPWQIGDRIGWRRQWLLTGLIALIAVLAMLPVARAEVSTAHADLTEAEVQRLLSGTPLAGRHAGEVSGAPLSSGGRLNVIVVLVLAHLVQAAMFTMVIASLLIVIGRVAITDGLAKAWLGHPRQDYTFLGADLPLDHQTVHTALLLGVIGALSFVLTSLSDPAYRELFFDPLVERVKVAVAAHQAVGSGREHRS